MKTSPARTLGWLAAAAVTVVTLFLLITKWFAAEQLPELNLETFESARSAWSDQRPRDYGITIEVTGRQPATYSVEVRDGQAVHALRNGKPLKDPRTFRTWTVDGMFETMEHDVYRNADVAGNEPLHLGARFDQRWQYPAEYLRIEWGTSMEVAWKVTEFALLERAEIEVNSP